jgi:hypothetical protein
MYEICKLENQFSGMIKHLVADSAELMIPIKDQLEVVGVLHFDIEIQRCGDEEGKKSVCKAKKRIQSFYTKSS